MRHADALGALEDFFSGHSSSTASTAPKRSSACAAGPVDDVAIDAAGVRLPRPLCGVVMAACTAASSTLRVLARPHADFGSERLGK